MTTIGELLPKTQIWVQKDPKNGFNFFELYKVSLKLVLWGEWRAWLGADRERSVG